MRKLLSSLVSIAVKNMGNMCFLILLVIVFVLFPVNKLKADGPLVQWQKTFGGSSNEQGRSVTQTFDGGYIISGNTSSYGVGGDVYLIKTDISGNKQWEKTFGWSGSDYGECVKQASDGGYIIAGESYDGTGCNAYLIKTDSSGNKQWEKTFWIYTYDYDSAHSVQQTSDGGYITAGMTWGSGPSNVYMIKTDSSGNMQWYRTFGGSNGDDGMSVQQVSDGGYIIAGNTSSYGAGGEDVYLIKTDISGNKQWEKTFGGSNTESGRSVQQTSDGGYIIAGSTWSYGAGNSDIYLIKTDSSGNMQWYRTFGGSSLDEGRSVQQTSDAGYIIAGWTSSYGAGDVDFYLVKTDSSGNKQWEKTFGGSNSDYGWSCKQSSDAGYIIAGWTSSYGAGYADVYLIKIPPPNVAISPAQNYIAATKTLSISATATDSFCGVVTGGAFNWILRDSGGIQKANGNLTYSSTAGRWTADHTFSSGLSSGNYIVYYDITTANGQKASTTGYLAIESSFNLSGRVTNASTGAGLEGVEIIVAGRITYTNVQGYYSFSSIDATQAPTITSTKSGYADYSSSINPPSAGTSIVHDFSMYPAVVGKPVITGLTGRYNGIFAEGIFIAGWSLPIEYEATVDWRGTTPKVVEFYANNTLISSVPATSTGAKGIVDVGLAFPGSLSPGANKLKVCARNFEGTYSDLEIHPVAVIPLPDALAIILHLKQTLLGPSDITLALDFDFPDPGIRQVIDLPVIGKFGAEIAANASFDYTVSDGDWEADFGVGAEGKQGKRGRRPTIPGLTRYPKMKLYIGNKEISGSIGGGARGTATITDGITFDEVFATGEIGAKLELGRFGLLDVIPGLSTVVGWIPWLSEVSKNISIIIYVEPEIGGEMTFALDPQFAFKSMEISGDVGLEAAYEPDLGICEMRLYVGGKPGVTFQVPGDLIKELRFKAYARAEFRAWLITIGPIEYVFVNITIPEKSGLTHAARTLMIRANEGRLQPSPFNRSYLADGPPRFVAYENNGMMRGDPKLKMAVEGMSALEAFRTIGRQIPGEIKSLKSSAQQEPILILQADLPLIENVFPFSEPTLAGVGKELMLLYVSDNGLPGELQFTDINWLRFDGTNWTTPAPIITDTRAEFAPQVAFDGDGDAVSMWERVKALDFNIVDVNAMAAEMEIVWSEWDRTTEIWSIPSAITDNNYLDHEPLLAGPMGDGSVLAVWTANEDNLLIGDSNHPSKVFWTKWSPADHSWSSPQILEPNMVCRMSQSFSGRGNKAVYAWTKNMDGDLNTPDDEEIFIRQWDDPNWVSAVEVTNDETPDRNVRVAVSQDGDFYIVWQRADGLVMDHNLTGTSLVRENSGTVAFTDYAMTFGPSGNLVLIWQEQSKEGVDAYYRAYDPACSKWSEDKQIFADAPLERSFAPVWDDVGNLTVAYNRVDIQLTNKTIEIAPGETIEVNDVPTPGRTDLDIFKRVITKNLAIEEGDLTAEGNTYLPGDEIKFIATVRNVGDLSVQDVNVAFYDGDPNSGVEIGRQTISEWLRGAESREVEILWRVPEPAANHQIFVVIDPNNEVSEFNETDNRLSLNIGGTDLIPKLLSTKADSDGTARIVAEVQNIGAPSSHESSLAVVRTEEQSVPIAMVAMPALSPGRLAQVAVDLPQGTILAGENMFTLITDFGQEVNDIDRENDRMTFTISGPIPGDLDGNKKVDWSDLSVFVSQWLNNDCNDPNWCLGADFDHSGDVDFYDYAILAVNWAYITPAVQPQDFDFDGDVDFDDLMRLTSYWLDTCVGPILCEGCDIDKSGRVDFVDFAYFADHWLEDTSP